MSSSAAASSRYALSFTTGGLLEREAAALVPVYARHRDWVKVRGIAVEENLLQARTRRTGVILVRETIKRVSVLSERELDMLVDLSGAERRQLMWAAACRRFGLIGEFAEEVLRERFLTLAGTVTYEEYDSFFRTKAMWHDELGGVTESTYKKLRQTLFRMMSEAGLIDTHGVIESIFLSARVAECLFQRVPSDIRFFPTKGV